MGTTLQGEAREVSKRCQLGLVGAVLVLFPGLSLPCPSTSLQGVAVPPPSRLQLIPRMARLPCPSPQSPLLPAGMTHLGVKLADVMSPLGQIEKLQGRGKTE